MNASDPLAEFFTSTPRESRDLSGRSGSYGAVDAALNELRLPAALDDDGDWTLDSDVGRLNLIVDDLSGDFVVVQSLQSMDVADSADFMHALLRLNFDTRGFARFGAIFQDGKNIFVMTARAPADEISAATVERLVGDTLRLSRRLDVLLEGPPEDGGAGADATGGAAAPEAEPAAEPAADGAAAPEAEPPAAEPPPPDQAPAAAPAAATVFAQPVPSGPPPGEGTAESAPPASTPPASTPSAEAEPSYPAPSGEPAGPAQPAAPAQPDPPPPQQQQDYPPPVHTPEYPPPTYPPPQPDLPPANWYPDPYYQARLRYWDGQQWTEHVAQ